MSTRAIAYLKRNKVPFELVKYEHAEKGAAYAAKATGYPLEQTVKTLVVELNHNTYCLALLPGHRELNLKKLAASTGVKRCAMVEVETAERLTGYLVGGISPFATQQKLQTIMDEGILSHTWILINAGQRGAMLKMTPADIVAALNVKIAPIAR